MKKASSILWGIVLIAVGTLFTLNALNIGSINIFFNGWWTLLIIIPAVIGLFTEQEKTGNIIALIIGVVLLLCSRGIVPYAMLWKLLLPTVIIIIGLKLIISGIFGNKTRKAVKLLKSQHKPTKTCFAVFSGCDVKYDHEVFEGATMTAVFGGIDCDLRHAIIEKDCVIQACAIFGGIDILVPDHVNVKVSSSCIFGGVENEAGNHTNVPTIYISGLCLFGGVEVK